MAKGKMVYVPKRTLEEVEDLIKSRKAQNRSDAFRIITDNAKVGKEVERIHNTFFGTPKKKRRK